MQTRPPKAAVRSENTRANALSARSLRGMTVKILVAATVLAASLAVSGCGNDSKPDLANGKTLFIEKCGACHVMARAGTVGTIGPNLDEAFDRARIDGMGDTIEGVTLEQIKWPSQKLTPASLNMPKDIVEGMDARDVAAYVGLVAGLDGKDTGELADIGGGTDGMSIFKTNCGSCHVFSDAGTAGAVGPNLDGTQLDIPALVAQIKAGGNGMPAFEGTLSEEQIKLLAEYLDENK